MIESFVKIIFSMRIIFCMIFEYSNVFILRNAVLYTCVRNLGVVQYSRNRWVCFIPWRECVQNIQNCIHGIVFFYISMFLKGRSEFWDDSFFRHSIGNDWFKYIHLFENSVSPILWVNVFLVRATHLEICVLKYQREVIGSHEKHWCIHKPSKICIQFYTINSFWHAMLFWNKKIKFKYFFSKWIWISVSF